MIVDVNIRCTLAQRMLLSHFIDLERSIQDWICRPRFAISFGQWRRSFLVRAVATALVRSKVSLRAQCSQSRVPPESLLPHSLLSLLEKDVPLAFAPRQRPFALAVFSWTISRDFANTRLSPTVHSHPIIAVTEHVELSMLAQ